MPHCIIEYSSALTSATTPQQIIEHVHLGALNSELFVPQDIKSRATAYQDFKLGCGSENFIHVTIKLLMGRTPTQKNQLSASVLSQLKALGLSSASLSVAVCDIDTSSYAKQIVI